ncbi:MAG TPA: hypothetical protein VIO14_11875 [Dehalococcoidia bacterium]
MRADVGSPAYGQSRLRGSGLRLAATVLLFLMSVATVLTVATGAIWTDTESVGGNQFITGRVDITTSPNTAIVTRTSPAMQPGDVAYGGVQVQNSGTLQFRYAIRSTTTEDVLAGGLDLTIKAWPTDFTTTPCNAATWGNNGTVIYGPGDLGSTAGTNLVGDPATGAQAGDRTLAAGTSEFLCFRVELPANAANTLQNQTTTATFEFMAEQS